MNRLKLLKRQMYGRAGFTLLRGGFGDNYYNTAILLAVSPESARLEERRQGHLLKVNGVDLEPLEKTVENGKAILAIQTDQTVKAIQKAIESDESGVSKSASASEVAHGKQ